MVRSLAAAAAVATTATMIGLGTAPVAVADQTAVDQQIGQSLVYIQMDSIGWVDFPPGVLDADTLVRTGLNDDQYPDQGVSEDHWIGPLPGGGSCTGVIVSPDGYIATAGHCVGGDPREENLNWYESAVAALFPHLQGNNPQEFKQDVSMAIQGEWKIEGGSKKRHNPGSKPITNVLVIQPNVPGRIITTGVTAEIKDFQDSDHDDNALLKVSGQPPLHALPVADKVPPMGTAITSAGFPGSVHDSVDPNSLPAPSFKEGTISSTQVQEGGAATTETSAAQSQGMSGGPTVNSATGEVIGLCDYGVINHSTGQQEASFNFITDASTLHSFLQKNGVQLVSVATAIKPFPLLLVGGSSVGALILLVAGGTLVVARRKKGTSPAAGPGDLPTPPPLITPLPTAPVVTSPDPQALEWRPRFPTTSLRWRRNRDGSAARGFIPGNVDSRHGKPRRDGWLHDSHTEPGTRCDLPASQSRRPAVRCPQSQ